jgi:hypothetical protein
LVISLIADTDLVGLVRDLAEALGAEFYCFECERTFYADHDAEVCPYCGQDADDGLYARNNLLGHVVRSEGQTEHGDTVLSPDEMEAAKERLSDEDAQFLEQFIEQARNPETWYGREDVIRHREKVRRVLENAFPGRFVPPSALRRFAVEHRDGEVDGR